MHTDHVSYQRPRNQNATSAAFKKEHSEHVGKASSIPCGAEGSRISTFESCSNTFIYCSFYRSGYGAADSLCWYLLDMPSVISLSLSCPLVQSTRSSSQLTENKSLNKIPIDCSWH